MSKRKFKRMVEFQSKTCLQRYAGYIFTNIRCCGVCTSKKVNSSGPQGNMYLPIFTKSTINTFISNKYFYRLFSAQQYFLFIRWTN